MLIKLDDLLKEVNVKTKANNEYPVLTSSKSGIFLQNDYFNKQVASKDNTGYKIIKKGQFTYRAMSDTGEFFPNILECVNIGIISPAYPVFEVSSELVLSDYLKWFFRSKKFQQSISTFSQGSTRTSLKYDKLKTINIKLPIIEKQKQIIKTIYKIDNIIKKKNEQLSLLDELVKSRFIELFGNPLDGTAKYPIHQVGEVAEAVDPQPSHRTPPIEEGGVPYVSIKDCDYKTGIIDFEGARKVSKTVLEEHLNRYTLQDGDFIIGKIGTIGKPVFVPARNDYTLSANIVLVQPNSELVSPYFLKYSFESDFVERQFAEAKNSTSQSAFGIQKVRTVEVMNPELVVQRDFERFVKQTDKSKFVSEQN